ncbi:hypothetical protein CspeluHIS016_0208760 [Cutaneotrichosporon spelunceum]|uniref:Uncharacterized protein n=1 Tax=Cutaneotrichosporon spelunceum TaxID=1672016 RepID=A0AAD3YAA6_9TREE|nr:hypothetical protein CspeluHIS016_0208760 [Cutaneotrichosporon spelunceum]
MSPSTRASSDDFVLQTPEPTPDTHLLDGSCIEHLAIPTPQSEMLHDPALPPRAWPDVPDLVVMKQRGRHTHSRSLSRSHLRLPFPTNVPSSSPTRLPHEDETAASEWLHLSNFSVDIHPGLRRANSENKASWPVDGTLAPELVPRAGTSLRRTRSSVARPERTRDPEPPLPHLAPGAVPNHSIPAQPQKAGARSVPNRAPIPLDWCPAPPLLDLDNQLAMTYAANVAVRRRVLSVSQAPTLHPTARDTHRRSASLGGDLVFSPPTRHLQSLVMAQCTPTRAPQLSASMPFTIPTRRAPPPPILVPRPPPPPPKSSPPTPPKTVSVHPKLPPPSRSFPLPPPGPPPKVPLPPLPLQLAPSAFLCEAAPVPPTTSPMSRPTLPASTSAVVGPRVEPSQLCSPSLGPDSAYARYRARARAKTLATYLPSRCEAAQATKARESMCETVEATKTHESLAETIAAIREAEEWDWPIPPSVRRPSPPTPIADRPKPQGRVERVERAPDALRRVESYAPLDHVPMHPFAAARYDGTYTQPRRGSTASLAAQHSGSSGSGSEGLRTPDECTSPQFALVRGPGGLVIKPVGPPVDRPGRRYGTPF